VKLVHLVGFIIKRQHLLYLQLHVSALVGPSSGCTRMYTDKMYNCVYTYLLTYLITYSTQQSPS
jgi:hypothetical protein